MAIVIERDQSIGIMNPEYDAGAQYQQSDAEDAAEQRHKEPVDDVGDKLAPAPPWQARIAGPEMVEHRKEQGQRDGRRHHLFDGLAEHEDNFHG